MMQETEKQQTQAQEPEAQEVVTQEAEEKPHEHDTTELKKGLKSYLHDLFDIRDDMLTHEQIDDMMKENTVIHGSNMWILLLAILIASIGLYNNSAAIIIGAMLISPLMNGILTMGYSLAVRDLPMLGQAFKRFATQVGISLIASTLFFSIARLDEPTAEMLARTSPTFWDVLIALFGGIAGIIGNTRQKRSNVIPGVAIATALMPPLCTVGYGLATFQPAFIFGALYLFLINAMLIGLSACVVTNVLKIPDHIELNPKRQKRINRIVAAITTLVVVPSILTGALTIYKAGVENSIQKYLENEFTFEGTQLVSSSVDSDDKVISVALVGQVIPEETIELLELQLKQYKLSDYTLHVAQNVPIDGDGASSDKITIAVQENTINQLQNELEQAKDRLTELENTVAGKTDFNACAAEAERIFGDYLERCRCGVMSDGGEEYFLMTAGAKKEITPEVQALIESWMREISGTDYVSLWFYQ